MNALQRAFLGVYSLVWIAFCTGLVVMAWNSDQKLDLVAGDLNLQAFIDAGGSVRWAFTAMMAALALVGVVTFMLSVSPSNRQQRTMRVRQADGTETTISAENIGAALKAELEAFPEISRAHVRLDVRNNRVYTGVDVDVAPEANVAYITGLVNEVVISMLRDRAGIGEFAPPAVRTRLEARRQAARVAVPARPVSGPEFDAEDEDAAPLPQIQWEAPEPRQPRVTWTQPSMRPSRDE